MPGAALQRARIRRAYAGQLALSERHRPQSSQRRRVSRGVPSMFALDRMESRLNKSSFYDEHGSGLGGLSEPSAEEVLARRLHLDIGIWSSNRPCLDRKPGGGDRLSQL